MSNQAWVEIVMGAICLGLGAALWRSLVEIRRLRSQIVVLEKQIEEALTRIAELERSEAITDGLVEKLIGLGPSVLILLVVVSTSGFFGAAAITSGLATLGGGMFGGIGVLLLMVPLSQAIAQYGFPRLFSMVVRGFAARGETAETLSSKINSYPRWLLSRNVRTKVIGLLRENQ